MANFYKTIIGVFIAVVLFSAGALDSIAEAMGNTIKSGLYDLVVMGTEGRHGFKKILNGSVAEKVMLHAACPVTIVRDTE